MAKHPFNLTSRRQVLKGLGAGALLPLLGACSRSEDKPSGPRVVVVGGGFGGATAAKYLKRFAPHFQVTLVEPNPVFFTCPFSNLHLAGLRSMDSIAHGYEELKQVYGVQVIHARAEDVDPDSHKVTLSNGQVLGYDRLLLSPGIDIRWDELEGYDRAAAELAPHAWQAGEQTRLLRRQLEAMEDGGVVILTPPADPFRCPPGPYERASLIAHYLSQHKPRSKVLILDAKDNFSKQGLFTNAWKEVYGERIEWVGLSGDGKVTRVDAGKLEVETEFGSRHKASVLNVIPPQKAGLIAHRAGVTDASGWVPVHAHSMESKQAKDIYVVGDATVAAPMPKSGFIANTQAKVAAAAIVSSLEGTPPLEARWVNTCYSLIAPDYGISVAHVYEVKDNQFSIASGGLSPAAASGSVRHLEAEYTYSWYDAITQDIWGSPART